MKIFLFTLMGFLALDTYAGGRKKKAIKNIEAADASTPKKPSRVKSKELYVAPDRPPSYRSKSKMAEALKKHLYVYFNKEVNPSRGLSRDIFGTSRENFMDGKLYKLVSDLTKKHPSASSKAAIESREFTMGDVYLYFTPGQNYKAKTHEPKGKSKKKSKLPEGFRLDIQDDTGEYVTLQLQQSASVDAKNAMASIKVLKGRAFSSYHLTYCLLLSHITTEILRDFGDKLSLTHTPALRIANRSIAKEVVSGETTVKLGKLDHTITIMSDYNEYK